MNWLGAASPEGVPGPDRIPLLALLRSTPLTENQVKEVVREMTDKDPSGADRSIDHDEIATFISDITEQHAGEEDVNRVAPKPAAAGWPLAGVDKAAH